MATTTVCSTTPLTGTWVVDQDHTTIEFGVKHVGLARVRGVFRRFEGVVIVGDDGEISASGAVDAASLDTRVAARDDHLRSADFFDVDNHPQITFVATSVEKIDEEGLRIVGDLTIRGVTRTVELTGDILGIGLDDDGMSRIGLDVAGVLDRRDFGLTWNRALDGGGLLVGNRVEVRLEVSAVRRP
jgi:polyisoprenoid-binding protein YceI